jgi:hypothetical protein
MVLNFLRHRAAINVLARLHHAELPLHTAVCHDAYSEDNES